LDISALGEVDGGAGFDGVPVVRDAKGKGEEKCGDMELFQLRFACRGLIASYDLFQPTLEN
jgi:hypothetical protein